ncbi:MAG: hypothetical protein ISR65_19080 [Bacteriovoracaceae bacterium]|nr:hypothetical protein [Bacteriovoracaceae bacterium]
MSNTKKLIYNDLQSLDPIKEIINSANIALEKKERIGFTEDVSDKLGGRLGTSLGLGVSSSTVMYAGYHARMGVGVGAAIVTSGLTSIGGSVGGGILSGVVLASSPILIFGVGGAYFLSKIKTKMLKQEKIQLIKEITKKQCAIQSQLNRDDLPPDIEGGAAHFKELMMLLQEKKSRLQNDLIN